MAQIKTVTTTSGENTITFDSFYPFVWIRNSGDNDITAANYSGASAGAINTVSIKAGEVAMIQAETENVYIIGATTAEIHAQGFAECPFKRGLGGGEQISVESLSVTTNGTYTAPTGTAYSPVVVDVQEEPWEPLEDGYSNFWFELSDDTLSPWLNFGAKNADATIDWGDGSGEQSLDTLTPTHTYSKAGKYVVKVKGVTVIGRQLTPPYSSGYLSVLKYVELNNEVVSLIGGSFIYCIGLKKIVESSISAVGSNATFQNCASLTGTLAHHGTSIPQYAYAYCSALSQAVLSGVTEIGNLAFYNCVCLQSITIPNTVATIGASGFSACSSLNEIHCQATNPPTLGSGAFGQLPVNYVIYVPVGTGETYKSAAGWSAYADHILEEGQTVTRAMQRKFAKEAKALEDTGDMR